MRTLLIAIVPATVPTATPAQLYPDSDYRSPDHWRYLQQQREEFDQRQRDEEARNKKRADMYGEKPLSPQEQARIDAQQRGQAEQRARQTAEMKALRKEMLRLAPLPVERNVLLGSWRLEGGGAGTGLGETTGKASSYKGGVVLAMGWAS